MKISALVGLILIWIFSLSVDSAEVDGIAISDSEILESQKLLLHGIGLRKATIFNIKVYVVAFYYASKLSSEDELLTKPKNFLLKLRFLRDISQEKIIDSFQNGFVRNSIDLKNFSVSWKQLQQGLGNFSKGDELVFAFSEGKLTIKSKYPEVLINQIEFIPQFLKLWFGVPPNEDLKKGLLSR